ncbi:MULTISPECIES: acyltransferase [unclassified Halomonas]|uniref:acyltransferase family protein n=1 Tax=unclassified Halomonas TaxID=2609666 RepID=UPI00209EC58F|nr:MULTISPECIES: acyltransferase [unclassified Halomonas]MCP1314294.1 acyltransferase [Halomonas sp. 707D7]MCP1326339.1 acyltransferase [Halomonas sp. 707D4]
MSSSLFNALHLMKVFGAVLVVTCHYAAFYYGFSFYSDGTACFFVVAGYYALNWERTRGIHYLLKRLVRLYPAYLVAVVAYLLTLSPPLNDWPGLIFHHLAFLLTVPDKATAFALNPPFWSLPVFFTFFALVAFLPRITPRAWQVGALMLVASAVALSPLTGWRDGYIELLVFPLHLGAFWLGGWIGHRAHRRPITPSLGYSWLAIALMALAVGCGLLYQPVIEGLFFKAGYYYRGAMVLVFGALFWAVLHSRLVVRPSRVLAFLGTISFGVYLFHNLPPIWLAPYLPSAQALPVAVGLSILLAWGSWALVEAPFLRFCKPRLARWMGAPGV